MGHDKENCECCCEEPKEKKMGEYMFEVADKAWMKVVQRRLEAMIEKQNGKALDKVAKLTYDYVHKTYQLQMDGKEMPKGSAEKFEKDLMAAMK